MLSQPRKVILVSDLTSPSASGQASSSSLDVAVVEGEEMDGVRAGRGGALQLVLVDDHPLLIQALRALLAEGRGDIEIVGEATTARDAVSLVDACNPDLVVMDIMLPGQSGLIATREIRRLRPLCKILILTAVAEPTVALEALSAGATGFALKSQDLGELRGAIDTILSGKRYVAPAMKLQLEGGGLDGSWDGLSGLSPREKEIFDLIVAGYSNKRLAKTLFISVRTVETHRARINRKLGVHSTAELLRFATRHALLSL
jgi:two-component system response regulator NreC